MARAKDEAALNLLKETVSAGSPEPTFRPALITATYDNRVGFIFMPGSRLK